MNRRIFMLITAAAMLLAATACGKTKTETPKGSAAPASGEYVWTTEEQELPIPAIVDMPSMAGDTIYFFQNEEDFSSSLYAYKLGDEEPAKLAFNTPWIYGFAALGDGTGWIAKSDQTMVMELCKVDLSTGDELETVPFNTADGSLVTLIAMPGDKLGAYIMTMTGKRGIAPFNAQTGRFGDMLYELPVDVVASECFSGNDLLVTTALTLDSVDNNSKERKSLFNWLDGNLNYQAVSVLGADEDSVVCFSRTIRGGGANATLVTLSRVPASSVKEKTVLTLAVTGAMSDYLRGAVIDFNRSSQEYKVEAITYDAGDTGLAGIERLNAEIVSGTAPDILQLDGSAFPIKSYNDKGILVDLRQYLDKETDIQLHPTAVRFLEQDGGLIMISPGFTVLSMIGGSDIVGEEPGWSLADIASALARNQEMQAFPRAVTRMTFYIYELIMNLQDFFDKDAGISRFDSDEFKEILNFTKELPENYPTDYKGMASDVLSGKNLVSELVNLSTFGEAALYESLFNGKQAYKGIPCAGRNGNILAMPIQLAMNTSCENKDAAWSFMRTLLTEEFQSEITDQFPTNMKVFDAFAQEAMREPTEDDIVKFVYYSVNGNIWRDPTEHEWTAAGKQPKMVAYYVDAMFMPLNTINCYELSENGYETLTRMIDGIDKSISYDVTIITIIAEETGSFFSGQKTVDQVCDAIQSRVNIYVNE